LAVLDLLETVTAQLLAIEMARLTVLHLRHAITAKLLEFEVARLGCSKRCTF